VLEISQAVEYGVRGIMYMARRRDENPVPIKEIAAAEEISISFLHKIFQRMARNRILNSRRGIGYTLARTPEEISILDVAEAIEGPLMIRRCILDKNYCERGKDCHLLSFWLELQEDMASKLSSVSLKDLISEKK
jgi:Rrf2 family protein